MELDNKVILKELAKVGDNIDAIKEQHKKEVEALKAELKEVQDKYVQNVADLNKDLGAKGATLEQIQGEVLELKAKGGRIGQPEGQQRPKKLIEELRDIVISNKEAFAKIQDGHNFPVTNFISKDVAGISTASLSGDYYHSYIDWRPGMEPTGQIRFRDLVRVIQSDTDYVQFPRANTPIGEGSFGRQATEGADKAQVDRDYTMIDLTLKPMAGFAIVSRQSLRNIPFLQTWLPTSMLEELSDAEDADFSNSLVGAATGSTTASGITAAAEKLIFYIKNLISAKYNPNGIAADPTVWATVMVTKPSDYSLPGVVNIDANGTVRIMGRPFYPVNWLTGNRVIVGDWTKAAIVQSEGLTLRQTDSHNQTFIKNQLTFLLERTEGLAVFRPNAFVTTTV